MKFFRYEEVMDLTGKRIQKRRWILFSCLYFQIIIHNILENDLKVQHDHPWWNMSIVLWGEGTEFFPGGKRALRLASVVIRKATDLHSIAIKRPLWTVFITGKEIRDWGFMTKRGWIDARKY